MKDATTKARAYAQTPLGIRPAEYGAYLDGYTAGWTARGERDHARVLEQSAECDSAIVRAAAAVRLSYDHGCLTGDCPHVKEADCLDALRSARPCEERAGGKDGKS